MANDKKEVLLSYAPDYLIQALKPQLEKQGFSVTLLREGLPPKKPFSVVIHAPRDAAILAEWTRELLNKAQADKSRFYLIRFRITDKLYEEAAGFAQSLIKNAMQNQEVAAFTLSLGRLFGPRVPAEESGALGYLLKEFAEKEFLTLYGDGKDQDYYLYLSDGAAGIAQAINTPHLHHSTSLTSPLPVTSEAVAKMLFDLGGGRHEIRYHRGIAADEEQGPPPGTPLPKFKATTSFQDGVMAALKEETPPLSSIFKNEKLGRETKRKRSSNIPKKVFPSPTSPKEIYPDRCNHSFAFPLLRRRSRVGRLQPTKGKKFPPQFRFPHRPNRIPPCFR